MKSLSSEQIKKDFSYLGNVYPSINPGWYNLLYMALLLVDHRYYPIWMPKWLKKLLAYFNIYQPIRISDIKEKYGQLRIYDIDDDIYDMLVAYSYETCEFCGTTDGVGQTKGWIYICCESCWRKTDMKYWIHNNITKCHKQETNVDNPSNE